MSGNVQYLDTDGKNYIPVTAATPLPTGATGTGDVNIVEVGGNAVTTTIPISGTVTVEDGGGAVTVDGAVTATATGAVASGSANSGNPVKGGGVYNSTLPSFSTGQVGDFQIGSRGAQSVQLMSANGTSGLTFEPDNADNIAPTANLRQVPVNARNLHYDGTNFDFGRSVITGTDSVGTGIQAVGLVGQYDDTAPSAVTENQFGNVRIAADRSLFTNRLPSTSATVAIAPAATAAADDDLVLKASAGNLYGFNVCTGGTAGYVMVFNATSKPGDGAVTPVKVYAIAANSSIEVKYDPPLRLGTGITVAFSSTGPLTLTASATAFMSGEAV